MAKDTRRDRVWAAIIELSEEPPTYRLENMYGGDEVEGFSKADVRLAVEGDISDRTVHDVIQTATEYGLLDMVKEPAHASVKEHPATGRRVQMDIYRLTTPIATTEADVSQNSERGSENSTNPDEGSPDPENPSDAGDAETVDAADRVVDPEGDTETDVDLPRASSPDELAEWLPDVGEHRAHNLWIAGVTGLDDLTDVSGVGKTTAERLKVVTAGYILDERELTEEELYAKDLGSIEDMFNMERETVERLVSK